MKKMSLEILTAIGSVAIFIILIVISRLIAPASSSYGYVIALLVFVTIMSTAGLKLAETPEK